MLRVDILNHFKNRAKKEGVGYQVLIQQTLANSLNKLSSLKSVVSSTRFRRQSIQNMWLAIRIYSSQLMKVFELVFWYP